MPPPPQAAYMSGRKPMRDGNGNIVGFYPDDGLGYVDQSDTNGQPYQGPNALGTGALPDPETLAALSHPALRAPFDPIADQFRKSEERNRLKASEDRGIALDQQTLHDQMLARGGGPQTIIPDDGGDYAADPSEGPSSITYTDPTTGQTVHQDAGPVPQGYRRKAVGSYSPVAARQATQDAGPGSFTDAASSYMGEHDAMTLHQLQVEDQDRKLAEQYHAETMGLQTKALEAAKNHDQLQYQAALALMNSPANLAEAESLKARTAADIADRVPGRQAATAEAGAFSANIGAAQDPANFLQPPDVAALPPKYKAIYNANIHLGQAAATGAVAEAKNNDAVAGTGSGKDAIAGELDSLADRDSLYNRTIGQRLPFGLNSPPIAEDQGTPGSDGYVAGDVMAEKKKISDLIIAEKAAGVPNPEADVQQSLRPHMSANTPHMIALRRALGWQ